MCVILRAKNFFESQNAKILLCRALDLALEFLILINVSPVRAARFKNFITGACASGSRRTLRAYVLRVLMCDGVVGGVLGCLL